MRYKGACSGHLSIDRNGMCCELSYIIGADFAYKTYNVSTNILTITVPICPLSLIRESCRRCLLDGFERAYTATQKKRHALSK